MSSPAAWHPDPTGRHEHRYWDGERWTEHVADQGVATTDPLDLADGSSRDQGGASETSADADRSAATEPAMPPIEPDSPSTAGPAPSSAPRPDGPGGPQARPFATSQPPAPGYGPGSTGGFPAAAPAGGTPAAQGSNPLAIVAMVLGIVAIVMSWVGVLSRAGGALLLVVAIAALVLGIIGVRKARQVNRGRGPAITGIVTGAIGVVASGLFLVGGEFFRAFQGEFTEFIECVEETGDEEFCQRQFEDRILDRVED